MHVPRRLPHGLAAVALVAATIAVVAPSTLRIIANELSIDRLLTSQIQVPPWRCPIGRIPALHRRVLVLYDTVGRYGSYGSQAGILAANFVSQFARPVRQPVSSYRRGEMARYAAVVYVGTSYGQPLPRSFLTDVRASERPVLWLGGNAYQLTNTAYVRKHGWRAVPDVVRRFTAVIYRHVQLTISNNDLNGIDVVHPRRLKVLGVAVTASGRRVPWAVRSGKLTYVAEVQLDSDGGKDRSFAVADMMAGMFGPVRPRHRILLRLEDVGPAADPTQLRQIASLLAAKKIPFSIALYPLYVGPLNQHPRARIPLKDRPAVVDAIKYMLSVGGTLVLHGYTHQLGAKRNPHDGESGDDFEFYRVHYNAKHDLVYDGPAGRNPAAWARHRIKLALAAVRAAGLPRPELWQFPEYGAAPADYRVAASMFVARFERVSYAAGSPGHANLATLTEQTPPYLVRDVYGGPVLPETLGYVMGPHIPRKGPGSISGILAAAAAQKVVRDNVAGVYYHPFLGTGPLRRLVDGLRHEGYRFVSPCAVLRG